MILVSVVCRPAGHTESNHAWLKLTATFKERIFHRKYMYMIIKTPKLLKAKNICTQHELTGNRTSAVSSTFYFEIIIPLSQPLTPPPALGVGGAKLRKIWGKKSRALRAGVLQILHPLHADWQQLLGKRGELFINILQEKNKLERTRTCQNKEGSGADVPQGKNRKQKEQDRTTQCGKNVSRDKRGRGEIRIRQKSGGGGQTYRLQDQTDRWGHADTIRGSSVNIL